jgi:hypothetical protein
MTKLKLSSEFKKIIKLTEDWGYDDPWLLAKDHINDGLMPSICMNDGCNYSTEMEPDQDRGLCECCNTNSVTSAAILLGVI